MLWVSALSINSNDKIFEQVTVFTKQPLLNAGELFNQIVKTLASLALLRGAKPKVISEASGHASIAFTMDIYSHIISGMQEDVIALLDEVLPVGVNENFVAIMSPVFEN